MHCEIYSLYDSEAFGIISIGYNNDIRTTRFGPTKRNEYIIHYVLSGEGYFNTHPVKKGQGFLITPQMAEHYYPKEENAWEFIYVRFKNVSSIKEIFAGYNADAHTNIFEYNNIAFFDDMKKDIIKNDKKMYNTLELYEIFLHMYNNHSIRQKREQAAEEIYYNFAVNHINSNLFRRVTVDELTEILGVSQPYLYHIFIKREAVSPKRYIDMQKIKKAKELLLQTTMSITQIANSIGMEDCIAFSKFFSKKVGVSPSDFRKETV